MTPTDNVIIAKVLSGNVAAFAILVNRYKDYLVGLAYNVLFNQQDAEEVAQDAFMKAFKALHAFKKEAKFSTWLYRILINTALDKKKQQFLFADINTKDAIYTDNASPALNQRQIIDHALKHIPVNERLCITLFYLHQLSVEEISQATNFSGANIKVLLHRGRKSLHQQLAKTLKEELNEFKTP